MNLYQLIKALASIKPIRCPFCIGITDHEPECAVEYAKKMLAAFDSIIPAELLGEEGKEHTIG